MIVEHQWVEGTTAADYLDDIRNAVRSPDARVAVCERWGEYFSATITPTASVVPEARPGPEALPWLIVIYAAADATIRSAYMFSSPAAINIGNPLWLR